MPQACLTCLMFTSLHRYNLDKGDVHLRKWMTNKKRNLRRSLRLIQQFNYHHSRMQNWYLNRNKRNLVLVKESRDVISLCNLIPVLKLQMSSQSKFLHKTRFQKISLSKILLTLAQRFVMRIKKMNICNSISTTIK